MPHLPFIEESCCLMTPSIIDSVESLMIDDSIISFFSKTFIQRRESEKLKSVGNY
jgi:hypothetical protein